MVNLPTKTYHQARQERNSQISLRAQNECHPVFPQVKAFFVLLSLNKIPPSSLKLHEKAKKFIYLQRLKKNYYKFSHKFLQFSSYMHPKSQGFLTNHACPQPSLSSPLDGKNFSAYFSRRAFFWSDLEMPRSAFKSRQSRLGDMELC